MMQCGRFGFLRVLIAEFINVFDGQFPMPKQICALDIAKPNATRLACGETQAALKIGDDVPPRR